MLLSAGLLFLSCSQTIDPENTQNYKSATSKHASRNTTQNKPTQAINKEASQEQPKDLKDQGATDKKEEAKKEEAQKEDKKEDKKDKNKKDKKDKKKKEKKDEKKEKAQADALRGLKTLELSISGTPAQPYNSRFKNDWYVRAYTIDDYGRRVGPVYFGQSDFSGEVDLLLPLEMFAMPMVVKACNEAAPLNDRGEGSVAFKTQEAFIPPFCSDHRLRVDPITTALWRDMYALGVRFGAQNWTPSNVDCQLWKKSGLLFYLLPKVQAVLNAIPDLDNVLVPLIPAIRDNPFLFYKTRHPECIAQAQHRGGTLKEGRPIAPKELENADEERFIHQFKQPDQRENHMSFYSGFELERRRGQDTATVGRNGLLRTLCANGHHANLFKSSLIINNQKLPNPNNIYDLESEDFVGNVSSWQNPGTLSQMSVKEYTVRQTNGFPRNHDMFEQVCSVTALTVITNNTTQSREISVGTGLILEDIFGPDVTTRVFATSDGNHEVDDQDTWAILFNSNNISVPKDLLGICNPNLFCRYGVPNFDINLIDEVLIIELLGFRNGDYRDVLTLDFNTLTKDLFIGLRAAYELDPAQSFFAESNFMTTITYINKKNMNYTLSLCNESADYLSRQHIDQVNILSPIPIANAALMIANSQCFSNSQSNQRWQTTNIGLSSMNNHKGALTNFYIPFAWASPTVRYSLYLKRFNESVFRGPITSVMPAFSGLSLPIPTLNEGDEILFASEEACCSDFKVTVPCTPIPSALPPPFMPVILDTTGINRYILPPPTGTREDLLDLIIPGRRSQADKPESNKPESEKPATESRETRRQVPEKPTATAAAERERPTQASTQAAR
jgi:hypothetical protein